MNSEQRNESWQLRLALLLLLCLGLRTALAQPTPAPLDYSYFKLITERNIFNSHRTARRANNEPRQSRPSTRIESFALLGTMNYEKGPLAFVDGTRSEYRKVLKPGDTIAGFKVSDIEPGYMKLASPTNEVDLPVGMQLRREEGGDWYQAARAEAPAVSPDRASVPPSTSSGGASEAASSPRSGEGEPPIIILDSESPVILQDGLPESAATNSLPAAGGAQNDILRRLMQRREQENNQ